MEVHLLQRLKHVPGVIQLLDFYEQHDCFILIMQRPSPVKDLFDFITARGPLDEILARDFFAQLLRIIADVSEAGVLHNDIKDENILVVQDGDRLTLRLIDFGSAMKLTEEDYTEFEGELHHRILLELTYESKWTLAVLHMSRLVPVAYLGFHKGGPNFLWPLVLTQRGGPNQLFQIFSYVKNFFFAKGGHGPMAP